MGFRLSTAHRQESKRKEAFCTIATMRHLFVMDPQPNDAPFSTSMASHLQKTAFEKHSKQACNTPTYPPKVSHSMAFVKAPRSTQKTAVSGTNRSKQWAVGHLAASISTLLHHQRCYTHTVSNSKPANHSHSPIPPLFGPRLHMLRLWWPPDCHRLLSSFPA
jgi:hypothetical protein